MTKLQEAINNMKIGNASGINKIPPKAIKQLAKINGEWILETLNQLLRTQKFPEEWKVTKQRKLRMPKTYKPFGLNVRHIK